ncbi:MULTISPECIES: hypothetical protein [unclassified Arthrobacter]|uniref:hypothetical protein n=1 Tax=unclassified Arthrobacter TaxID=235627 RepID=UPI0006D95660|nr:MULTISPECIES: hypothetical protein [unclassified Arthrobacter]KPN21726.1 hypothetical protein AO716_01510 [Arthrobacter sp. Edens01]MSR99605.1 hypothetical protein [Arthrobacter sp. BL-252-APC-1A]
MGQRRGGGRNSIARDVAKLLSDLDEAQREAANRIASITGSGRSYAEHDLNMRDGPLPYGFDDSEYLGQNGGRMDRDLPWYQDTFNFTRDTLIGIPEAGWEFVKDLGVFMAFQGADKRGVAWKGLYRLSENVLVFAGAH